MKVQVERNVLSDAVTWTARSLPARPPVPVLAGILLEATEDGQFILSAFDYEVSARVEVAADVDEPGQALVSGRLLAEISRQLPAQPVELVLEGTRVTLTCGASRFTLGAMPVEDYPTLPAMPPELGTINSGDFAEAVGQVAVAASKDETLPILTGVRMKVDGEGLALLATDRYRLGMRELGWRPDTGEVESAALVRARTLTEVARTLGAGGDITLALSDTGSGDRIGFSAGGRQVTSLLIDGDYPVDRVQALFPSEAPIHAVVQRAALIEAVKRVSLVAERNTPVRLSFIADQLTLDAGQADEAQASEAIPVTLSGEDITIAFNPHYLLDGLAAVTAEYVRLSFTLPTKPAVLTGQAEADGDDDAGYRYLIMPIRMVN